MKEKNYSQVKAMLAVSKASLRSITRSPSAVVFTLLFPMVFIVVFGFIGGGSLSIDVAVKKDCEKNSPIYSALQSSSIIRLDTLISEADMKTDLEKGRIDASISIRKNSEGAVPQYTVFLETTSASPESGNIVKSVLNNIFYNINAELMNVPTVAELKATEVHVREYKTIDFILPGQLGFSLLSSGVFGTAFVFLSLRQTLVIKRFFATPIKRPFIIMGEALSRLVFSLAGALLIILIGHFAFGFTLLNGIRTILDLLLLSGLGLIVFMGFGFVVSGIAKTESSIPPIANIITLPQFLLSGTFFSISVFPTWLQPICNVLPLTYLNDAMRKVAFEGADLMQVGSQIGIIALWGVVVYFVAVKVFRWE